MKLNPLSWPVLGKVGATAILAAGAGAGAALAVHGGQRQALPRATPAVTVAPSVTVVPTPAQNAPSLPDFSADCFFGANGADIQVGIDSPTQSCGQWVRDLAGSGLVWYPISQMTVPGSQGSADDDTLAEVCDLTDGTQELFVEDGGSAFYGDNICNQEEQNGWTPEGTPGPLASVAQQAEQQEEQQQEQASASAAASQASAAAAAQAQQERENLANDDQGLDGDVSALDQDLSAWVSDLATANSDYKKLLSEPVCNSDGSPNQNTYDDAQNVYDDGQSVYDDESSLTNDLSTVQSDLSTVKSDIAQVGTSAYAKDVTAAQTAVSKAQAAVNADTSSKIQNEAEAVQTKVDDCTG